MVSEVYTPLLEGYAGFYDPDTNEITISEDLDDLTIIHETSHAWFNKSLFTERWITEGLADEYAARVLRGLDRGYPGPPASNPQEKAAFPLSDWAPPAAIRDVESQDRESYGYAASWSLMRRIVDLVGEQGMRAAAGRRRRGHHGLSGRGAPRAEPDARATGVVSSTSCRAMVVTVTPPAGPRSPTWWRRSRSTTVNGSSCRPALPRGVAYVELVKAGGEWAAPVIVRMAMDGWDFGGVTEVDGPGGWRPCDPRPDRRAGRCGGPATRARTEADYQDAGSIAELAVVADGAVRSLAVLRQVAGASDVAEAPRDWLTEVGLEGADPASEVAAARAAWERADLEAAEAAAGDAVARLAAAPEAGRRRSSRSAAACRGARAPGRPRGVPGSPAGTERPVVRERRQWRRLAPQPRRTTPARTLHSRRMRHPAEPPGRPPSGDEGADPS